MHEDDQNNDDINGYFNVVRGDIPESQYWAKNYRQWPEEVGLACPWDELAYWLCKAQWSALNPEAHNQQNRLSRCITVNGTQHLAHAIYGLSTDCPQTCYGADAGRKLLMYPRSAGTTDKSMHIGPEDDLEDDFQSFQNLKRLPTPCSGIWKTYFHPSFIL